ncbi:ATP-grasp domain-containing protein [Enterocloster citroniae]|uniref:ATP-grasp domain-containing protein n=1 Tax=Enterocloster citroniae TaxID=358743 RepID=UPI00349E6236
MKAFVLAGGLPQITLIKELKSRNVTTILADGSENALARPYADQFYQVNIFDIEAVKSIAVQERVDFLITCCADQVLLVVAQVSELLGLPCYLDYETAKLVSDKELMKKVFVESEIPTSQYVVMDELDLSRIRHLQYPLIVKPVDAYSSKGVRKVLNTEELKHAFEDAVKISRTKTALVEEFFAGEEISVDIFVVDGKAHILCVSNSEKIRDDDRFVIFRGRFPVHASPKLLAEITTVSQRIADAFKLKNAPMLVQMITDGKRVSVLEFCARTGGGMKYLLIRHACGVDVIRAVVDLAMGMKLQIHLCPPENHYIVNDFIYCRPGVFDHLEGFEEQLRDGNLSEYHCLRPKGMKFTGIASSSDRIAGITIQADSLEEFNRKHNAVVKSVKVVDSKGKDMMRHDLLPDLQ